MPVPDGRRKGEIYSMNVYYKSCILVCLFLGLLLLFRRIRWLELLMKWYQQTCEEMEESERQRLLSNRKNLLQMKQEHSLLLLLERELHYSGLKRYFTFLTAENFLAIHLAIYPFFMSGVFLLTGKPAQTFVITAILLAGEYLLLQGGKLRMMRRVNNDLLKLLDFLGNYSITVGEITGVLHQISKYMEEPLQSALLECSLEAQTTGDISMALLSMAEKIEHPKFKELVQSMEISARYSADFTALVISSRRSVREYLRQGEERKSMLVEAVVNMLMLLAMSLAVFLIVNQMIAASVWSILFFSLPGRIALWVFGSILFLFLRQIYQISK